MLIFMLNTYNGVNMSWDLRVDEYTQDELATPTNPHIMNYFMIGQGRKECLPSLN